MKNLKEAAQDRRNRKAHMTRADIAVILGCGTRTVTNLLKSKRLASKNISTNQVPMYTVTEQSIKAFIKKNPDFFLRLGRGRKKKEVQ